jgi:hypothetical protein
MNKAQAMHEQQSVSRAIAPSANCPWIDRRPRVSVGTKRLSALTNCRQACGWTLGSFVPGTDSTKAGGSVSYRG